jgi:hypothetical protein
VKAKTDESSSTLENLDSKYSLEAPIPHTRPIDVIAIKIKWSIAHEDSGDSTVLFFSAKLPPHMKKLEKIKSYN